MNNRFKFNIEQCEYCIFSLGIGCDAPCNSIQPLICEPVDRLYESFNRKVKIKIIKKEINEKY